MNRIQSAALTLGAALMGAGLLIGVLPDTAPALPAGCETLEAIHRTSCLGIDADGVPFVSFTQTR